MDWALRIVCTMEMVNQTVYQLKDEQVKARDKNKKKPTEKERKRTEQSSMRQEMKKTFSTKDSENLRH